VHLDHVRRTFHLQRARSLFRLLQEYISDQKNQTYALLLRMKIKFREIFLATQVSKIFLIITGKSIDINVDFGDATKKISLLLNLK